MPEHKLCVPCLFGLEGPLGNELRHMGLRSVMPENGRVRCTGTDADIARINLRCRFGERVLLELGSFPAPTFDALFEGVKALPWAQYLPADAAFPVKGYSLESALHSVPDCQKIIKKAVVESLKQRYHVTWFAETGALYQIQFSLVHDTATLYLDTTGTPLHKRGYRPAHVAAPLRETLAAALVDIAGYRGRGDFCDPFCGSGTIAIEAALAAKGRAPGIGATLRPCSGRGCRPGSGRRRARKRAHASFTASITSLPRISTPAPSPWRATMPAALAWTTASPSRWRTRGNLTAQPTAASSSRIRPTASA